MSGSLSAHFWDTSLNHHDKGNRRQNTEKQHGERQMEWRKRKPDRPQDANHNTAFAPTATCLSLHPLGLIPITSELPQTLNDSSWSTVGSHSEDNKNCMWPVWTRCAFHKKALRGKLWDNQKPFWDTSFYLFFPKILSESRNSMNTHPKAAWDHCGTLDLLQKP